MDLSPQSAPALSSLSWEDPFLLENQLLDEEQMIRESAHAYTQEKLAPRGLKAFSDEETDPEIFREMGEMGFLGTTIPEEYGGLGSSYVAYGLFAREVERVDSGYRSMMSVQSSLVMYPIYAYGIEEQRRKYFPKLTSGEWICYFGLTEPDAGSDPGGMTTTALKTESSYRLNGSKMWVSNSPIADVFIDWAKPEAHQGKIRGFVLEKGTPGLRAPKIDKTMSLSDERNYDARRRSWGRRTFAKRRRPKSPILLLESREFRHRLAVMDAAEDYWHSARQYGLDRRQFNKPLGQTQLFQLKLVNMQTEIALGLKAALRAGRLKDEAQAALEMISLIKRNNCGKALEIAGHARDMHGGNSISLEFGVIRHMINLETVKSYEGTHDIHALIIGRAQTGPQAFS